jgi:POT family proton-dependent oligopeptide transporter
LWNEGDWTAAICLVVLMVFLVVGALVSFRKEPEFVGHPKGLVTLFFTEMWERFSYYGMRALLVFYLTQHWLFSDAKSNLIYGAYTSLVFVTPVLGGYFADRWLGQRKAVIFGGVLLAIGHSVLAIEGHGGQSDPTINIFWFALALIIVGVGFLKANVSVIVGQLYSITDPRRDPAYTIFYMGINAGAAAGSILVGYVGQVVGWRYGFGLAGIGMIGGLLVFVLGRGALLGRGAPPDEARLKRTIGRVRFEWWLYGAGLLTVPLIWALIQYQDVVQWLLIICGIALLLYVLKIAFGLERDARDRILVILFLIALEPLFWALYEQAGGSLNLYTDRFVNRGNMPASIFQAVQPAYLILLAPLLAWLWTALGRKGLEPSAPAKFGWGIVQVGLSFLVFVWGAKAAGAALTPVIFVYLIYLLQTTAELCLSPVGLSAMNRLAPSACASLIMGAWFYMTAAGEFLAGKIGEATGNGSGGEMTKQGTLTIYNEIGWVGLVAGIVVLSVSPFVKRLMHLDTLKDEDLAGRDELAEPAAAGMHPEREISPRPSAT